MEAYISGDVYDIILTTEEIENMPFEKLKTDLKTKLHAKDLEKKVTLTASNEIMWDAELNMIPKGACWDDASGLDFKIRKNPYDILKRNGRVSCRMAFGDIFLYNSEVAGGSFVNH